MTYNELSPQRHVTTDLSAGNIINWLVNCTFLLHMLLKNPLIFDSYIIYLSFKRNFYLTLH